MNNFEIIPAVDILDGKAVRLKQGKFEAKTIYFKNPLDAAKKWEAEGAKRLHVVDLDGARTGNSKNLPVIKKIAEELKIPVQLGGGIRHFEQIEELLDCGINRVILGTSAIFNPNLLERACKIFGDKIIVAIDAKENKVAAQGWKKVTTKDIISFAKDAVKLGVKRFVYTDISKDGMLTGPNFEGIRHFIENVKAKIIASGGIASAEDIEKLRELKIEGCIVGIALYAGTVKLSEIL
ncbi:MAG: 1-(5-phosphoribosyl)-5-[(5-phosphoribosylamino)methylideneamino]imidazole-4-carboxamide isomerase [Candidatus Saganbacteria bacterium]|nr:1-(5-phosphoribosyl)-5-[(5-phosphoribosylamino)methylideneamino]imidazole-4-carboxamide isomerase [Candidatus Saganbacteria bacterium]